MIAVSPSVWSGSRFPSYKKATQEKQGEFYSALFPERHGHQPSNLIQLIVPVCAEALSERHARRGLHIAAGGYPLIVLPANIDD